jgi:hypothetical protein
LTSVDEFDGEIGRSVVLGALLPRLSGARRTSEILKLNLIRDEPLRLEMLTDLSVHAGDVSSATQLRQTLVDSLQAQLEHGKAADYLRLIIVATKRPIVGAETALSSARHLSEDDRWSWL